MNLRTAFVDGVLLRDGGQVAVHVIPPEDVDLQFIYRAGLSIYWNPNEGLLEDRTDTVESAIASAARIARAMREEYGLALQASAKVHWQGIDDDARDQVATVLFG